MGSRKGRGSRLGQGRGGSSRWDQGRGGAVGGVKEREGQ